MDYFVILKYKILDVLLVPTHKSHKKVRFSVKTLKTLKSQKNSFCTKRVF